MAKKERQPQVKSGEGRVSFPHVFEKHSFLGSKPAYELILLFPKASNSIDTLKTAAYAAVKAHYGDKPVPDNFRNPIVDGDIVAEKKGEAYKDCWAVKFKTYNRPGVVDILGLKNIEDADVFYPGCWARVTASPFIYTEPTPGLSFWLNNVLKVRDDEPFSATTNASDDFGDECQEAGADDEANYAKPETSDKGIFG